MRSRLSWRVDRQTDTLELIPVNATGNGSRTSMEDPGVKPATNTRTAPELKSGVTVTGLDIAPTGAATDNKSIKSANLSSKEDSDNINNSNNLTTSLSNNDSEGYPEGGIRAWLVVLGAWLALFAALGLMNILATFQTYVSNNQLVDYDASTIGWIFSLYTFVSFFMGIYVGPLFDKYGPRWLVLSGTLCLVLSLIFMSISYG